MTELITPKLKVPFEIIGPHAAVVEQDGEDEIAQCVAAIVRTRPGTRPDDALMGLPDFTFRQDGADLELIRSVLVKYEPRASTMTDQELVDLIARVRIEIHPTTEETQHG